MTLENMMSLLLVYLDDPEGDRYTRDIMAMLLNMGQDNAVMELRWDLTPEINILKSAQVLGGSDGSYNYVTGLAASPPIFRDRGIIGVKLTDGRFCSRRSFREHMDDTNVDRRFDAHKPIFWAYGNSIYVDPYTDQTIDLYYRRRPIQMAEGVDVENNLSLTQHATPSTTQFYGDTGQSLSAVNDAYNGLAVYCSDTGTSHIVTAYVGATRLFTVTPALTGTTRFLTGYTFRFLAANPDTGNTECELDQGLHDVIVQWAAGLGYQRPLSTSIDSAEFTRRRNKADEFITSALAEIARLNQKFIATDSIGPNADLGDDNGTFRINMDPALLG